MHVAIVNLNLAAADAIGRCVLNQVRYFRRRGDCVTVYIQHPSERLPDDIRDLVRVVSLAQLAAGRDDQFRRCDLYVYHYPAKYDLLETIRGVDRGAVILFYHNVTPPEFWDGTPDEKAHLQHSIDNVSSLAYYADLIVTPSDYNADQLTGEGGLERERIRVLPLAVDLAVFAPGGADPALRTKYGLDGHPVMLYVGRMAGNKRVDLLVDALVQVRERVGGAALLLVGDQSSNESFRATTDRIKAKAAALGVSDAVIFAGVVDDLPAHYRLADVYVSASLHEGFGVPLIEAMACGVPLVVSDASAHPWVVGAAGLLCASGDAADMAAKVVRVLTDDEACGELVQRGLLRARQFSLEAFEDGWARIVAEATAWLPRQPYPRPRSLVATQAAPAAATSPDTVPAPQMLVSSSAQRAVLQLEIGRLESMSDVMIRGYVVRSRIPIVGPLIAWFRRNVTSHLREPYVDPMIERQVAFNRELLQVMRRLVDVMTGPIAAATPPEPHSDATSHETVSQLNRIETLLNLMSAQMSLTADSSNATPGANGAQMPKPPADSASR